MCSIIASKDLKTFNELANKNLYRGISSYSIYEFLDYKIINRIKKEGLFNSLQSKNNKSYLVGHLQTPTNSFNSVIHPTEINNTLLWHNGIIKRNGIKQICDILKTLYTKDMFDTYMLHRLIYTKGFKVLSEVEGLFSFLYYNNNNYYIARTKHNKLYIDKKFNISSEYFNNSYLINYDTVYKINIIKKTIEEVDYFTTKKYNIILEGNLKNEIFR